MDAMKVIARLARILPVYGVMDNECYSDLHCLTVAADLQFASKSLDIHLQKLQTNPFGVFVAVLRQADKAPFYLFFFPFGHFKQSKTSWSKYDHNIETLLQEIISQGTYP